GLVTLRFAVSVPEDTEPVPIDVGEAEPPFAVSPAFVVSVVTQLPTCPTARSCSEESTDCDERVSITNVDVHSPCRPSFVRSSPPSKNVPGQNLFGAVWHAFAPEFVLSLDFSVYSHGEAVGLGFWPMTHGPL